MALIFSAGRFFVAELGKTWQSTTGISRVVPLEGGEDELQVAGDDLRRRPLLQVVRADEQHDRRGVEGEHVLLEPQQHAARGVAADPAVRDLHAGERRAEAPAPALGDRVAEEDDRAPVLLDGSAHSDRRSRHRRWNQS